MIPVIDLSRFSAASATAEEARKQLVGACEEWGCFRVVNHGIPEELMMEMKGVVRSLFGLPEEVKRRNVDVIEGSGYVAPSKANPLYEALGLYDAGAAEAVDAFCSQLEADPRQRVVVNSYSQQLHGLAIDLATKIAQSLCLSRGDDFFYGWPTQFRINKYAFTEETVGSPGVQIHTDSGFLTILQEDDCIGGLEVMSKAGTFIPVDPSPGSFVINLGDIAKIWSNGRFCNLKHRVQCKEAAPRYSIALFLLGPREEKIKPPPALVNQKHPQLYQSLTYEDYRRLRLSSGLRAGEALDLCMTTQSPTVP